MKALSMYLISWKPLETDDEDSGGWEGQGGPWDSPVGDDEEEK